MNKNTSIITMYAVTPCHVGSGLSLGIVDLPIVRERHTNWPVIPSSGMKGAMRAHFDRHQSKAESKPQSSETLTEQIFGSEKTGKAGLLSISDGKILAFPMRSNIAPFIHITCPAVLKRLVRDLKLIGQNLNCDLKDYCLNENSAFIISGNIKDDKILLEDMEVTVDKKSQDKKITLEPLLKYFEKAERLLCVSDEVFNYGVTNTTSIVAQIKINQETGTTQDGSLRYQEELPADTLMYSVIFCEDSYDEKSNSIIEYIKNYVKDYIQIGGDVTCGRGFFELSWIKEE